MNYTSIIFNGKVILFDIKTMLRILMVITLSQYFAIGPGQCNKLGKEKHYSWKGKKTSLFLLNIILYIENPKESLINY